MIPPKGIAGQPQPPISLNLYSRRRPSRQNSDKLNFLGGTEESAGGQIMKRSSACATC